MNPLLFASFLLASMSSTQDVNWAPSVVSVQDVVSLPHFRKDHVMSSTWYIFADLDALNQDVCAYMRVHATSFSDAELAKHFPVSAYKLTKLLSHPDGVTKYFQGTYYYLRPKDVGAFQAAGWEMRPKSESKDRSLGHLPPLKHNPEGVKILVLVAGKLASSVLDGVDKYFEAGWCVLCYCFRARGAKVYDLLTSRYPLQFQCIYLDNLIKSLIKEISGDYQMMFTARDRESFHDQSILMHDELSSLYKYIHEVQVKATAMEAYVVTQRTKQHDNLHHQLQEQKEAFALQLRKQDEDSHEGLQKYRKLATPLRKCREQHVKERVEGIATALPSLGELSKRVKEDVDGYQRAQLDAELARWRREIIATKTGLHDQGKLEQSTSAVDFIPTGMSNRQAALAVLTMYTVSVWLLSDNYSVHIATLVIVVIALCVLR